jgi:hypothetical protein
VQEAAADPGLAGDVLEGRARWATLSRIASTMRCAFSPLS